MHWSCLTATGYPRPQGRAWNGGGTGRTWPQRRAWRTRDEGRPRQPRYSETCLCKTATCGLVLTDMYREVAALQRYVDCHVLVLFRARVSDGFREVAAVHSDHLRQVLLYRMCTLH